MAHKYALPYDSVTGAIESVFNYVENDELAANTPANHKLITADTAFPEAVDRNYYVIVGTPPQLVPKYTFAIQPNKTTIDVGGVPPDGVLTVTKVPIGTLVTVYVNGFYSTQFTMTSAQQYTYTTTIEGTHRFNHALFPYITYDLTITAVLP